MSIGVGSGVNIAGRMTPDYPLVCLDETSKQFLAETRLPIPMKRGRPARCDYEYERNGTANIFMMFAPLEGWRHVKVTDRHTAVDYAHVLKELADRSPTPGPSYWSRTISTSTARGHSTKRFQPPRPGRWSSASNGTTLQSTVVGLIWQKSELGVLTSQCLGRRIADKQTLVEEIAAWEHGPQCQSYQGQLAILNPQCPYQTQAPLPCNLNKSGDY